MFTGLSPRTLCQAPFQCNHGCGYCACYRAAVAGTAAEAICASRLCLAERAAGAFRECSLLRTSRWIKRLSMSAGFTPPILHACPTSLGWICAIQGILSALCLTWPLEGQILCLASAREKPAGRRQADAGVKQMQAELSAQPFDHTAETSGSQDP